MPNSPSDAPSGGGPLDPEQAERLAELFKASWEVLPTPETSTASPAAPGHTTAPARPGAVDTGSAGRRGAITSPEVPLANPKKTLLGIPPPPAVAKVEPASSPASAPVPSDPRAANKRTLMGVAPPAAVPRGPSPSTPPPVKVPSHAPPPPPPPPLDAGAGASSARGLGPPSQTPQPHSQAAKSSPRSSRPSGVAKVYVPKENEAQMPAVVVDAAALRDGEAAAAAEEARRRARAEANRSAQTMRARAGDLDLPPLRQSRTGLWVGAALLCLAGAVGGGFLLLRTEEGNEAAAPARAETSASVEATTESPTPVVPSPEALPLEPAAPTEAATPAAPSPAPLVRPTADERGAPSRSNKAQPATRQNTASKRPPEGSTPARSPAGAEPQKRSEPAKKSVIVRDAPF